MTTQHLKNTVTRSVSPPQSAPLREDQVPNSAGGFSWAVDKWTHLRRFLVLGSAGGTYYIGEKDLTDEGLKTIEACLAEDGFRLVNTIVEISEQGRAPKNDYAVFALAVVVAKGDDVAKAEALDALPRVARIGTHLFQFVDYLEAFGTLTGRAKRRALARWYATKDPAKLAYEVIKYRQREGWSHRDVLRLAHPAKKVSSGNPSIGDITEDHEAIFDWVTRGWADFDSEILGMEPNPDYTLAKIEGFERIQRAESASDAAKLITLYGLPREAVPTEHLKSPEVWQALLDAGMPATAMIRNLANMTRIGLLTQMSGATKQVVAALKDQEFLNKARVHPMNVLFALRTYQSGGGWRSDKTWTPVQKVVDALDGAFYLSFGNVEPTGKRVMLALDVSGSMGVNIGDTNLTARDASAAMALVTANVEDDYMITGFSSGGRNFWRSGNGDAWAGYENGLSELSISPRQRLDDVIRYVHGMDFGGTDCSLPMLYAEDQGEEFDAFVIYTDSETWAGKIHPAQAIRQYRKSFVPDARLVVVGMTSNGFTIADPKDPGMLDVVGFDTATPQIISDFVSGKI